MAGFTWTAADFVDRLKVDPKTGCWEWQLARVGGYGHWMFKGKIRKAHHISLFFFKGVPLNSYSYKTQVDHLCRNRCCANPSHLEIVSARENLRRAPDTATSRFMDSTHCKWGHPFDEKNTGLRKGGRFCRTCDNLRHKQFYERKRGGPARARKKMTDAEKSVFLDRIRSGEKPSALAAEFGIGTTTACRYAKMESL